MGIIVNVDECIGCHACFIACKQENQVSPMDFFEINVEKISNFR